MGTKNKAEKIKGLRFRDPETGDHIIIDADSGDFYKVVEKGGGEKKKKVDKESVSVPNASDGVENSGGGDEDDEEETSSFLNW
mgnify:CR=1 FL=1